MGNLICVIISLMDKSFCRNDVSMSCSLIHHSYLEAYQKILSSIDLCDVPDELLTVFLLYRDCSIDFGNLCAS